MRTPPKVRRGAKPLRRLLEERTFDLRSLDLEGFRQWLAAHLPRWQRHSDFVQRARIRDLRRAHPQLRTLEGERHRLVREDAASPQCPRLERLEQELLNTDKAIAGLGAALERAGSDKRPALLEKLTVFQAQDQSLREEQARLVQSSPQRQALLRIDTELQQFRSAIGLDREEAHLAQLLKQQGRRSGHVGESFEELALTLSHNHIVPDLLARESGLDGQRLHLLTGVTLGAAGTEFDQLVVWAPEAGRPVEVLAAVEVKRNINDLGHGFRRRQQDLAWLSGDRDHYDPALCRTNGFPTGHFDREAVHRQDDKAYLFAPGSFRRFQRDGATAMILDRLYFITRRGTVWGVSAAGLGRISHRVATNERWDPGNEASVRELLDWCQTVTEPMETPDVLRLYASMRAWGRQILLIRNKLGT
jgi:hypothetical protein